MIKKIIFSFFLLLGFVSFAQVWKIDYQTTEKSTNYKSELFYDKLSYKSIFINYKKEIKPGTAYLNEKDELTGELIDYKQNFLKDFEEQKVYSDAEIKYIAKRLIVEPLSFEWKINAEVTKDILGYKCVLATTNFKGRLYTAYFTKDIAIPDGPRKFSGLPGLIMEIFDDSGILYVKFNNISVVDKMPDYDFNKNMAISWEEGVSLAKKIYLQKKTEIENKYNSKVNVDFSGNLEQYDLNLP